MKTDFPRYGNLTPEELNAALAATGSMYRVPPIAQMPTAVPAGFDQFVAASQAQEAANDNAAAQANYTHADTRPQALGGPGVSVLQMPQEQPAAVEVAPSPDQAPPPPPPRTGPSPMRKFAQGLRAQAAEAQATEDMTREALGVTAEEQARISEERAQQIEDSNARQLEIRKQQSVEADALGARMQRQEEAADAEKKAVYGELKEINALNAQNQIKDSRTTTQRVLGALALVGSGVATGYSGAAAALAGGQKTNYLGQMIEIINAGIERDIEIQRENARGGQNAAAAKLNEWQIAGQFTKDAREQTALTRAAMERKHAQVLDAEAQSIANKDAAAVLRQGAVAYRQSALERENGIVVQRAEKARDRVFALDAAQAQAASSGGSPMGRLKAEEQALKNEKLRRELGAGGAGGESDIPGYRRTKEVSSTVATQAATIESLRAAQVADLQRLEAIRQRNKGQIGWSGADAREAALIKSNLADRASQLAGGGQAGEAAKAQMNDLVPDPTDVAITSDPSALYRQAIGMTNQNARARLKTYGYASEDDETAALTSSGFVGGGSQ